MTKHNLTDTIDWMGRGTEWCLAHVAAMSDSEISAPSALPGWTRAHILAHLARNAEALERLLLWATTGLETPMYSSPEQRSFEIEAGSREEPAALRRNVVEASFSLARAIEEFPRSSWSFKVQSAIGRTIPASEVPWLRTREVWLHAVDLNIGAQLSELIPAVVHALIDDIVGSFASRPGIPSLRIVVLSDDGNASSDWTSWSLGDDDGSEVKGTAVRLLAWLSGRSDGSQLQVDGPLPALPAWL